MTIPASDIVQVTPGVLGAGGGGVELNGVFLTKSELVPIGSAIGLVSTDAVKKYFGVASDEYALSIIYFNGFDNSTVKPGLLYFAPYADTGGRAAWLRSGSFAGVTLATIKTYSGVLTLTVDGTPVTSSTIDLSGATSQSNAATLITAGFSGGEVVCTWDAINSKFTLTSATTGATSTITEATGTLSTDMKFTTVTGAIVSQGANADTPTTAMESLIAATQNWATFTTLWEPSTDDKILFAEWVNGKSQRYAYVPWNTDEAAITNTDTTSFGYLAKKFRI
jgi:hypothetical protein